MTIAAIFFAKILLYDPWMQGRTFLCTSVMASLFVGVLFGLIL